MKDRDRRIDKPQQLVQSGRAANLFDLIRIVAAAMVIVGHAWPLLGVQGVPRLAGISIHHLGVFIFFSISGFLLSTSWQRSPRPASFMVRRCLRIFPALAVVVLATVFAIGPALTELPQADYWTDAGTWRYLLNLSLFAQYDLPGVFQHNTQSAVNGSLWSLGPEFCCYMLVVALGFCGSRCSAVIRCALIVAIVIATFSLPIGPPLRSTALAAVFFLAGSLYSRVAHPERLPLWIALVGMLTLVPLRGTLGLLVACIVIPYVVIAVGSRGGAAAGWVRRAGDPSYGMYLWGFPIQQGIIAVAPPLPLMMNIAVVLALSAAAGYASWHLLEKRAIALGSRLSAQMRKTLRIS